MRVCPTCAKAKAPGSACQVRECVIERREATLAPDPKDKMPKWADPNGAHLSVHNIIQNGFESSMRLVSVNGRAELFLTWDEEATRWKITWMFISAPSRGLKTVTEMWVDDRFVRMTFVVKKPVPNPRYASTEALLDSPKFRRSGNWLQLRGLGGSEFTIYLRPSIRRAVQAVMRFVSKARKV